MKKIIYSAAAMALAFFAASCQQENLEPVGKGNTVTYTVEAPGALQTKAIADGMNVNELVYEVWLTSANGTTNLNGAQKLYQATAQMFHEDGKNKATVTLDLVNDQHYTVLFWAQVAEAQAYNTTELTAVSYAKPLNEYLSNDESLAAFYAVDFVNDGEAANSTVLLKRPFAQVNLCTLNSKDAAQAAGDYNIALVNSKMTLESVPTTFNVATKDVDNEKKIEFAYNAVPGGEDNIIKVNGKDYYYAGMNYVFAGSNVSLTYDIQTSLNGSTNYATVNNTISDVPVRENFRTNIVGNLLTSTTDYEIIVDARFNEPAEVFEVVSVSTAEELVNAIAAAEIETNIKLEGDINLNELGLTKSEASVGKFAVKAGKDLIIDLNGNTLYGTSNVTGGNYEMIDVRGNLTIVNGTVTAEFLGADMGWGASTNVFNVTAGGVLTLKNVTAKNLGGSAMAFVAHLNNWGDATINVENSTLESTYIAVRAFNSGPDMNYVTIKNSTLKAKYCFWVHNYKKAGDSTGDDSTLALDIYNGTNTFEYTGKAAVLYGFNNPIYYNAEGCMYVSTLDAFKTAIAAGTSVVLDADIDYGTTQLAVTAPIRIDLGGHTLTTANNYGGISLKGGPSIVNGTINHTGNTAAIKAWNVGTFENLTINVTPTEGKVKGGIVLQSGAESQVGAIKNVTITGATNGIETYNCGWTDETPAIVSMENVNIDATGTGILLSAHIAKAKDCQIKGANYGINMHLKGEFKVGIALENCTVTGDTASIWGHDEKGISNTNNCSLSLSYDAATTLNGPFIWDFEDECLGVVTLNRPE